MSKYDFALKRAEQMVAAIDKKLGDTKGYARLVESPEFAYIEMSFCEKGKSALQEVHVSYAAEYFAEMKDVETAKDRGQRILKDVTTNLGR